MPIYLEDLDFDAPQMPEHFVNSLLAVANATIGRPVTPGIAMELLRTHLMPLLDETLQPLFRQKGQPSWDSIHWLYGHLLFASEGHELELTAAGCVVGAVYRHSRRPPRELLFPSTPEVDSFARMAKLAGLSLHALACTIGGDRVDLLRFCKYCWRPARNASAVCDHHSAANATTANGARYKQAQRLRAAFEGHVNRIATKEEWEFHESEFKADVFFPSDGTLAWLRRRRPRIFEALQQDPSAMSEVDHVLQYLYAGEDPSAEMAQRTILLTPVTLRAEAWLQALSDKGTWGGARPGTGPKQRRDRAKLSTTIDPNLVIHS